MPDKKGTFKFVCIPADVSESLQELTQDYTDQNEVECLLNRVKVRYIIAANDLTGSFWCFGTS